MKNAQEVLQAAAEYISEHGWCREALKLPTGEVCISGAIRYANTDTIGWSVMDRAWDAVNRAVECEKCLPDDYPGKLLQGEQMLQGGPIFWNDKLCESKEDAVLMLKRAQDYVEET